MQAFMQAEPIPEGGSKEDEDSEFVTIDGPTQCPVWQDEYGGSQCDRA